MLRGSDSDGACPSISECGGCPDCIDDLIASMPLNELYPSSEEGEADVANS
jgi:hypothetical protein